MQTAVPLGESFDDQSTESGRRGRSGLYVISDETRPLHKWFLNGFIIEIIVILLLVSIPSLF